ncbi:sulfatase-like hydrolase/transferase [Sneathiella sp. P13V-1]|uniref:alkaline phosphatase family protein n=1 Tax=Sneathiella sp. P13V-1 TaxID=2697366 RepID=UPI00187B3ABC|nr:alkaline phosphatase family protein [Sneathiella sp. P13V-1]MBE7637237.1 sulfatase-like hydrolase/transferase [Sneathiella sp. P13V-1]
MNVLFITIDQWRADFLAANGNDGIKTPNLDQLAADGVLFQNHFSCSAPCGPSRATLHTGMYPSNHRAISNGTPLDGNLTNLALEARKAGYEPALFGYTDVTADPRETDLNDPVMFTYEGILKGYKPEVILGENSRPWLSYLKNKGYDVPGEGYAIYYPSEDYDLPDGKFRTFAPSRFKAEDSETAWLADQAIDYMANRYGHPFFCHLSFLRPHPPFIAPPEYHDMYDPADMKAPKHFGDVEAVSDTHPMLEFSLDNIQQSTFYMGGEGLVRDLTEDQVRQIRATYSALVSEVDANVGRIVNALKEAGEYENTLIIVTADHGEQLGDHHLMGKLGFYDQSFHIPLIIKAPEEFTGARGRKVTAFTESIDVMPTILEMLNAPIPNQCNGLSVKPWLEGKDPENWRDAVHWLFDYRDIKNELPEQAFGLNHNQCNMMVYRDAQFKYVHFVAQPPLLFDLVNDPEETRNLAEEPDYQAVVLDYAQKMLSWRMENENHTLDGYLVTAQGMLSGYK